MCVQALVRKQYNVVGWALLHGCPIPDDDLWETKRTRLMFLTCLANKQHLQQVTQSDTLASCFLKLPFDVIQHIAMLM